MKFIALLLMIFLPTHWEPDFEHAKKLAKEKNELILLNFSGSDWCVPCIVMHRDYFNDSGFTAMADDNLVMVNADFPRKKKNRGTADLIKRNEALAEKYNKEGLFPLTLLLNADGKVIKTWKGKPDVSVAQWTQEVKNICDAQK
ncbi:thioredoxin family protein [Flavobacterium cerinum]|uniref:Thioredoxin family protein n=1 Tax=Flavobacterium cerinum TaxID=2502784 RepID=A0ABY5IT13_9FLAO|nr:thioredoxin family protein [Flavobacterium cerinum]UUC45987.1 thioredoxin family protein [Flavobacterium cerinum]